MTTDSPNSELTIPPAQRITDSIKNISNEDKTSKASIRKLTKPSWSRKHTEVLIYTQKGWNTHEIAKALRISTHKVTDIRNSEEYKTRESNTLGRVRNAIENKITESITRNDALTAAIDRIVNSVPLAAEKIVSIMKSGVTSDKVQLEAAKEILHMAGFKPPEIVEQHTRSFDPIEVQKALETAKEIELIAQRLSNQRSTFLLSVSADGRTGDPATDEPSLVSSTTGPETSSE